MTTNNKALSSSLDTIASSPKGFEKISVIKSIHLKQSIREGFPSAIPMKKFSVVAQVKGLLFVIGSVLDLAPFPWLRRTRTQLRNQG